jgi:hypothetical protein
VNKRDAAAVEHLRAADRVMRELIDSVDVKAVLRDRSAGRPADHYGALVRSIVGQQLSTRAARAIYTRLTDRYGGRTPTPVEVLEDDPDKLKAAAGLSQAKVSFLRSLAEHVLDGSHGPTCSRSATSESAARCSSATDWTSYPTRRRSSRSASRGGRTERSRACSSGTRSTRFRCRTGSPPNHQLIGRHAWHAFATGCHSATSSQ